MGWNSQNVFTILIVQGGAGSGIFVYSPSPGAGNLIGSWAGQAGTDPYGNSYPAGLNATTGTFSGSLIAGIISNTPIGTSSITGSDFSQGTIETTTITLDASGGTILAYGSVLVSQTFNANGNITFPAGVTQARVQCWGGGGGGAGSVLLGGAAGGGGEYAEEPALAVHAATYAVTVGAGGGGGAVGANGVAGALSSFPGDSRTVRGHPGAGGVAGSLTGANGGSGYTGNIHFNGGNGGGVGSSATAGGGGGSSAGRAATGNNGGKGTGSAGGAGGVAPAGGGAGGAGGNQNVNGVNGSVPGGGGGGGGSGGTGGNGAAGQVIVSYQTGATALIAALAAVAGTDAAGNAFGAGYTGQVKAFHPGVTPAAVETWQSLGTLAGYTVNIGRFRLTPDNELELDIKCAGGGAQAQTVTFSVTLPAAYRPATQHDTIPMGTTKAIAAGDIWPRLLVSTAGAVTVNASPSSATTIACCVRIPLD
jgi:hypothetical protein